MIESDLDRVFVEDVMYLFDLGESLSRIAYIVGCDVDTVDRIVCGSITAGTTELGI